jgi:hypothetical protein
VTQGSFVRRLRYSAPRRVGRALFVLSSILIARKYAYEQSQWCSAYLVRFPFRGYAVDSWISLISLTHWQIDLARTCSRSHLIVPLKHPKIQQVISECLTLVAVYSHTAHGQCFTVMSRSRLSLRSDLDDFSDKSAIPVCLTRNVQTVSL